MKIAILGTHSAGKTTLSYLLAAKYKKQKKNVKIIQEVARSCPYALNEGMSKEACLWIYHEHIKKELEAKQKHDMVICDRSAIDSFVYAMVKNCLDLTNPHLNHCFEAAKSWMQTYQQIIFVSPDEFNPDCDGFRSTDVEFQVQVHDMFQKVIDDLDIEVTNMQSKDIFTKF